MYVPVSCKPIHGLTLLVTGVAYEVIDEQADVIGARCGEPVRG